MKIEILKENYVKIGTIYAFLAIQYTLTALIPFTLGKAIDGLLTGQYHHFITFLAAEVTALIIGYTLKRYDTKVFMNIFSEKAIKAISILKAKQVEPTKIVTRYGLVASYSDYFEFALPQAINAIINGITAITMLCYTDSKIGAIAIIAYALMLTSTKILSHVIQKNELSLQHTRERITNTIVNGEDPTQDIRQLANNYVSRSNNDALNFFNTDLLSIALKVTIMIILTKEAHSIGTITSTLIYADKIYGTVINMYYYFMFQRSIENTDKLIHDDTNGKDNI
jgi:ABC-type multidrug transport system fused ATPase/permease subunit